MSLKIFSINDNESMSGYIMMIQEMQNGEESRLSEDYTKLMRQETPQSMVLVIFILYKATE